MLIATRHLDKLSTELHPLSNQETVQKAYNF